MSAVKSKIKNNIVSSLDGSGIKKKKTPIIVLKKTAPKKKQFQTGKLKVVPTSQAEKIAKAVASLIPRPKGKKKSTIESRMIKTKKESIKLPFEELVLRRLGKEEQVAEKEEAKKPRKERADKGTHRKKWYEDRGLPIPSPVNRREEVKAKSGKPMKDRPAPPAPKPLAEIIVEPAPEPVHITVEKKPESKKPTSPFKRSKSSEKVIERLKMIPPSREKPKEKPPAVPFKPPTTGILAKPPSSSIKTPTGDTKNVEISAPPITGSKTTPAEPMPVVPKKPRMRIPKKKPFKPFIPKSPETDEAGSSSESSIQSLGEGFRAAGRGGMSKCCGLKIAPPKKNSSARGQKGL